MKEHDLLTSCLSLQDALEIQKKGVAVVAYFWKSVVQRRGDRSLSVPYLYVRGDGVVLRWHWLDYGWVDSRPAVRFAS